MASTGNDAYDRLGSFRRHRVELRLELIRGVAALLSRDAEGE